MEAEEEYPDAIVHHTLDCTLLEEGEEGRLGGAVEGRSTAGAVGEEAVGDDQCHS